MSIDATDGRPDARREVMTGLIILAVVAAAVVLLVVVVRQPDEAPPVSLAGAPSVVTEPPVLLASGETYVRTEALPAGDLLVTQWIESDQLLFNVLMARPQVEGAEGVTAQQVRVVADDRIATGPEQIRSGRPARYSFLGATSVQISYRLTGALEFSSSAPGRALAPLTSLDVTYEPASTAVTRAIVAPEVLSLACASPGNKTSPRPCGAPDSRGTWTVEVVGPFAQDRVIAQLSFD